MRNLFLLALAFFFASTASAQTTWGFDAVHSNVGFSITHLVISEVDGSFAKYEGKLTTSKEDFTDANIDFSIDVASINTGNEKRDGHLTSPDFFDAANHPKITFKGKSMKKVKGNKYKLTGDLSMKGVTKEVELDVKYSGTVQDPYGNTKAGFKITGELNRFDYGLKWDAATESGNLVVSKEVELDINVQLVKMK
ncbi:MAG: YceI family protein [Bacteroidia bacterium]|nr:YceI family protein [Bacteroidia bacterium]